MQNFEVQNMENESRPGCGNCDVCSSIKVEYIGGQVSTTSESAKTNLHGSRRTTRETPSETLVIPSPLCCRKEKQLEKQMQTPAKRTLERVDTRRENIETMKSGKQSKLDTNELIKRKKQGLKPVSESFKKNRLNAHSYKELLRSRALKAKVSDVLLRKRDELSGEGGEFIESNGSNEVDKTVAESCSSYLKMRRSNAKQDHDLSSVALSKDGKDFEAGLSLKCRQEPADHVQSTESQLNVQTGREHIECVICLLGGELLCCDGQECKKSFHLSCLDPPFTFAPPGVWHCVSCVQKKLQFGVHSVSDGIESILEAREVDSDHEVQRQKQFLVKYKGLAHVHNRWIPERQILLENLELLARYKKFQNKRWKIEWTLPQRLLQRRLLCLPKHGDGFLHGHDGKDLDCQYEWLVKWTGLGYDHATWELENAAFLKSPEAVKLVKDFESRHKNAKRVSCLPKGDKGEKIAFSELFELPSGGSPGVQNEYISNIDKLRACWQRGQNALVYDGQERVLKVILFILSLQGDTLPFLIITTSSSLSVWEAEFSRHTSDINTIVYKGNKEVRASIRSLELCNEDGCIMFQVLLSPPDAVAEDSRILGGIKWGAIIVDECQRPRMSLLLNQIKDLATDMKLLLVNGIIKDRKYEYLNMLSFLDSGLDGVKDNASEYDPSYVISELKARLACFVAFECKLRTSRFVEYWVPVRLSNVQLEQYCAALLSKEMLLCSHVKNGSVDSLRKILILTRKCCDHPYLVDVDNSLRRSITRDVPVDEHLDAEIGVSGKLQLLDKFLFKIKDQGLRVLILFQSIGDSGLISTGDILDDFVHQRFGRDSYARIDGGEIPRLKKQAALDLFNNKESDTFVLLMESRDCVRSIKLSCVDTIILFDSDWNPLNDLRALDKITIESQFEEVKVFRLYSSHTVEEKVLILANEGVSLDSNIQNIVWSSCHMLLTWGALHLFNKLDDFHGHNASVSHSNITSEEPFISDVVSEFSALLPSNGDNRSANNSIIFKVQQIEGTYPRNISLPGEVDLEAESLDNISLIKRLLHNEPPHIFWTNLLEGRHPRWKFLSISSRRICRRTQDLDDLPEEQAYIEDGAEMKRRIVVHNTNELICSKPRTKKKRKLHSGTKDSNLAAPGISRGSDITNASTLQQEARQHYRAVTSIIGEPPTLELIVTRLQPQTSPEDDSKEHQLHVSTDLPLGGCGIASVPASIFVQNHRSSRSHLPEQQAQVPIHPARVDSTGLSTSSVSQPITVTSSQPSVCMPAGTIETGDLIQSTTTVLDGNNQPHEVPQSICLDPLEIEMDRTQKDKEQAIKIHEDMKLRLKVECEKEIDEIRKKYDMLLQHAEIELFQKKKDLETYYNKVHVNKLLAKAFTQKYTSDMAVGSPGTQEVTVSEFMNEISHLFCRQSATRSTTPLTIQSRGNGVSGCEFRAPAPHLRHLRSSTEVLPPLLPPLLPTKMQILRAPSNSSATSCGLAEVTQLFTSQFGSISGTTLPDCSTGLPVVDGSFSGAQLPASIINLPAADLLSQFTTLVKLNST